ncbi:MAG: synthase (glutamine-hydrolyzing), partial [Actinomycetia bacterium]|nr:synthase (glutamine-hydrolyzing) [Actinomycetes bacterium]
MSESFDTVLVVDFGAQYAQLIARRVREAHVYSEIVPHSITAEEIRARNPVGVIFSGGPASVHQEGAPRIDEAVYDLGTPVLGICYGAQLVALQLGGEVAKTGRGEYGRTSLTIEAESVLFGHDQPEEQPVWMSHFDTLTQAPPGFVVTARTADTPAAVIESVERKIYGMQFHPEVGHTPHGQEMLKHFLYDVCQARPTWTMSSVIETQVELIRKQVGSERVICALSGGVDSAVAALLVHKAVGDQLTCVFVDHGLLRKGEAEQ